MSETQNNNEPLDVNNMNPNDLRKLLDQALQFGTDQDLENLFDRGMPIDQQDWQGRTALMAAAHTGKKDLVIKLIQRGADVNKILMHHERVPLTALDAAQDKNRKEIIEILLSHGSKTGRELQA